MDCKVICGFDLSHGKMFHCFDFPLSEYRGRVGESNCFGLVLVKTRFMGKKVSN